MLEGLRIRLYTPSDLDNLIGFLNNLSAETRQNFAPHPFDKMSIRSILHKDPDYLAFIATDKYKNILAYQVLKRGITKHDRLRISAYDFNFHMQKTCSFAPVVTEEKRTKGIGTAVFNHLRSQLVSWHIEYLVLWGGVRDSNKSAIAFYKKHGFHTLGEFEHHGTNMDMYCKLNTHK